MTLVRVEDLRIDVPGPRGRVVVVDGVSFTITAGTSFGLVGESGSGKSVTALSLVGLGPPTSRIVSGRIEVGGVDATAASPAQLRDLLRDQVGIVLQNPMGALNPRLSVGRQLVEAIGGGVGRVRRGMVERAAELLADTGIRDPGARLRQYPHELSGGLAQRVAIAMALAREPRLLIADEPTTALDAQVQAQILDLVDAQRATRGLAVLLVSHDLGVIADRTEQVAVMRAGRFVETGATREVVSAPRDGYTRALLEVIPRPGRVLDDDPAPGTTAAEAELPRLRPPPPFPATRTPLVSMTAVTKVFDATGVWGVRRPGRTALRAVDLDLAEGDALGVVGESGSGKSTLARILVGLESPTTGRIELGGALAGRTTRTRGDGAVQYVFQDSGGALDPRLRVRDIVGEFLERRLRSRSARLARAEELLAEVQLPAEYLDRYPRQLSGGQRQRVAIARALAADPTLLVADEPVSALDVSVQARVINLLNELRVRRGMSYLVISHDIGVVSYLCNRVLVLRDGEVQEQGPLAQVLGSPASAYTVALLDAVPGRSTPTVIGAAR